MPTIIYPPGSGGGGGGGTATAVILSLTAGESIAVGDVVRLQLTAEGTAGRAVKAQANANTAANVVGVATTTAAANGDAVSVQVGGLPAVQVGSNIIATSNGLPIYLDPTTSGRGTVTAPTGSGQVVVHLGYLVGATGATPTPTVLWTLERVVNI
jgi:hypothetical protein